MLSALWPSTLDETFNPEWSLRDEVEALARLCLNSLGLERAISLEPNSTPSDGADGDASLLSDPPSSPRAVEPSSAYIETLVEQVSIVLTRIFTNMAKHRTPVPARNQLLQPKVGWNEISQALRGSNIIDES
jgi:hypothetical protein